jgi:hypothetical protein
MVNRQSISMTKKKKLQKICKKSSVLALKSDKNSQSYDKMKNRRGLLGHRLKYFLQLHY